jgi:hypothetical protein
MNVPATTSAHLIHQSSACLNRTAVPARPVSQLVYQIVRTLVCLGRWALDIAAVYQFHLVSRRGPRGRCVAWRMGVEREMPC